MGAIHDPEGNNLFTAVAILMIREAGGIVTDLDGGFASGNIVAGAPPVQRELLEIVQRCHVSEEAIERVNPNAVHFG